MTCDPKFRKVLITDAKSPVGQALVEAIVTAGADLVWAGCAEPWKKPPGFERLSSLPKATLRRHSAASIQAAAKGRRGKLRAVDIARCRNRGRFAAQGGRVPPLR